MKHPQIPLWLTLTEIKVMLKLSVNQEIDESEDAENRIQYSDALGYGISSLAESSRIIEIRSSDDIGTRKLEHDRFSNVNVNLRAETDPSKKYKGTFFYLPNNAGRISGPPNLSLYLNVPELAFNKFREALTSGKISSLSVGVSLEATQDEDVGAFGPPSRDDLIYVETVNGTIGCRLTEIISIVNGR